MMLKRSSTGFIPQAWVMGSFPRGLMRFGENFTFTLSFSRRFYPKRLTRMYTHFTFTLMAHCTSVAIRGSVSCPRTLRQGIFNLLITKRLLYLLYHCRPRSMHPNNQNANKSDHAAQHGRNMTSQLPYHPLVPFLKMSDFNLS